ncbi:amidohydrolase family protein [Streptomyces sp. NPDC057909]|uniref:amidohydrolase family protein n=1 Tax=Streptomyces sp. NPDC057909 TaxID=3346277 RepID=UPI0036EECD85
MNRTNTLKSDGTTLTNDIEAPPLDAIRTATTGAAKLLGLEGTVGRLRPGFTGDMLVLDGDPLADVTVLKKPARAVRAGVALQ